MASFLLEYEKANQIIRWNSFWVYLSIGDWMHLFLVTLGIDRQSYDLLKFFQVKVKIFGRKRKSKTAF